MKRILIVLAIALAFTMTCAAQPPKKGDLKKGAAISAAGGNPESRRSHRHQHRHGRPAQGDPRHRRSLLGEDHQGPSLQGQERTRAEEHSAQRLRQDQGPDHRQTAVGRARLVAASVSPRRTPPFEDHCRATLLDHGNPDATGVGAGAGNAGGRPALRDCVCRWSAAPLRLDHSARRVAACVGAGGHAGPDRRGYRVRDRIHRGQDPLGGQRLGLHSYLHPPDRGRSADFFALLESGARVSGAAVPAGWRGGLFRALRESRDAAGGESQPGAVQQRRCEPGRGRLGRPAACICW